jgi:hypothetical protein
MYSHQIAQEMVSNLQENFIYGRPGPTSNTESSVTENNSLMFPVFILFI